MKRLVLLMAVLCLFGGCATTGFTSTARLEPDLARMAAVERASAPSGVRVYWVNPPQRLVAAHGS